MNDTWDPGQKRKANVDEKVGTTASVKQHRERWYEKAEYVKAHGALKVVR